MLTLLLTACTRTYPPPPRLHTAADLPVSGSLQDAHRAGFTHCLPGTVTMRCRREGVMLLGHGPFSAAVDLDGGDGRGGFRHLTLWHATDQSALGVFDQALRRRGWRVCFSAADGRDDRVTYFRPGGRVRVSADLSFYMKRTIRITPVRFSPPLNCWSVL